MTTVPSPTDFLFISDPGHGWLVCDVDAVNEVGLSMFEFSSYSFGQNGALFLEEDCDATLFVLAFEAHHGRKPTLSFVDVPAFDRNKARLPGTGYSYERWAQKCKALDLLIASRKLAEGEAA